MEGSGLIFVQAKRQLPSPDFVVNPYSCPYHAVSCRQLEVKQMCAMVETRHRNREARLKGHPADHFDHLWLMTLASSLVFGLSTAHPCTLHFSNKAIRLMHTGQIQYLKKRSVLILRQEL